MSTASGLLRGSAIKSKQEVDVQSSSVSSGTGRDRWYVDITISAVDVTKTDLRFEGCFSGSSSPAPSYFIGTSIGQGIASCRLTSSTNVRISSSLNNNQLSLGGLLKVLEFA